MTEKIDLSNLPCDVISNISSFVLGKPEHMRLKHNKALKKIQNKFKPYCTEEEREEYEYFHQRFDCSEIDMKGVIFKYQLMQGKLIEEKYPLYFYIGKQYEKIKNIIDKEIGEQFNQDFSIDNIYLKIGRRYKDDREYDVSHLIDNDYFENWNIKNVENFDNELEWIIDWKHSTEADLYIEHDDAVVSYYDIYISLRFRMLQIK